MNAVSEFIKRSAEQCGFERNDYVEKNMPTSFNNIIVVPFFGDIKSTFIMSSFLMNQYKNFKTDKYLIICSWPGHKGLYPYADEFWHPKDLSTITNLVVHAEHMNNSSDLAAQYQRSLISRFENVLLKEDLQKYYNNGFQPEYFNQFNEIKRYFSAIPSASKISTSFMNDLNKHSGQKVVIFPSTRIRSWQKGKSSLIPPLKDFWVFLTQKLLDAGITPVIYQNNFTFDLSRDFADKCVYLVSKDMSEILSCMRQVGCVLDMHNAISRLAIAARCPFVCVDERIRFMEEKEYEIDDLCCQKIPKQYIFSFSSFLVTGDKSYWGDSIIDNVVIRLQDFLPTLDREEWASTSESEVVVSYDCVRERKVKRLGTKFIRRY